MLQDLLEGAGRSIVFGLIGIGLMALGYLLIDWLTPGKLRDLIWTDRNPNASRHARPVPVRSPLLPTCRSRRPHHPGAFPRQ